MIKCLTLSATFVVLLIREKTNNIRGYIEKVNEKAVVAYYENFTRPSLLLELTMKFKKGSFQSKSLIIVVIKSVDSSNLKWKIN